MSDNEIKRIKLTRGQFALVDDADYDWLNQWKWYAHKSRGVFYAVRMLSQKCGKHIEIRMHRLILGLEHGDKREGDHRNHNTLDNQQVNLRICTHQQNTFNQKSPSSSSQFKGVSWHKAHKKWQAYIKTNGKIKYLGIFKAERDAALVYDTAAIREFGEFAYLNFN